MTGASRVALLTLAVALAAGAPVSAITLDGRLDPEYGPALGVQTTATSSIDNLLGDLANSDGSELDALHATIADGVLYVFLAGNQLAQPNRSDPGFFADVVHLFFDTRPGGQHTLRPDNFDVGPYPGYHVLQGMAGLTFETDFAADWWLGEQVCDPSLLFRPPSLLAWRAELLDAGGGAGEFLGQTDAGPTVGLTGGTNPLGVAAAFDNSNVAGVPHGCDAASGAGVTTGVEWAIPLAALGDPPSCIRVVALVTYMGGYTGPNQALPPLPTGLCQGISPYSALDLGAQAGEQVFTICPTGVPAARSTWGRLKVH